MDPMMMYALVMSGLDGSILGGMGLELILYVAQPVLPHPSPPPWVIPDEGAISGKVSV